MSSVIISEGEDISSLPGHAKVEIQIPYTETCTVGDKTYTVYVIDGVEDTGGGSRRICVRKRYSQFADLHHVIRKALMRSHTGV